MDGNEVRKQRLSLSLPMPNNSLALQEAEMKQYESLCEQQPIGRTLFRQFLLSCNPQYIAAIELLEELGEWSIAEEDAQAKTRRIILAKIRHPDSRSFLKGDAVETCEHFDESTVNQMREATRDFLRGKPFSEYLRSPFFFRFLQWKEYEKQTINDKYFQEFRKLGKGGFGEVCAVQVKITGQMYACKKLDKRSLKKNGGERLALQEKKILEKAGTTGYMAPEILKQQYYSTSVDWWALGCSIYEMVAARLPFRDFREKVQKSEVARRTHEDLCKFHHKGFDPATKDIICCLLKKKVAHRLGCKGDDPRKHTFFMDINFHRLEAQTLEPPWMPKPKVVYIKDTSFFNDTSELGDIDLDARDENFSKEFSTGAVPVSWQKEMIDSGLFDELNKSERNGYDQAMAWKSKMCVII
ncbi:rhodopsin kinase grk7-b isoform X3 [Stigmatopora argus]